MGTQTTDEARWRRGLAAAHHRAANGGLVHCARHEVDAHTTEGQDEWPALLRELHAPV